nr:reverse transcriptase domain-containing protein [Tanacetum cinerariifolium]
MFKQLHINITLADALILMPKYQKMLKALLSNKEKLQELANTPLNENCSAVILKKLPEKVGDPRKFLIPCGFSELKCNALADLGKDYAKTVKNQSKPGNIGHEIERLHQKPDKGHFSIKIKSIKLKVKRLQVQGPILPFLQSQIQRIKVKIKYK